MHQTMKMYKERRQELNHQIFVNPNERASITQCIGYIDSEPLVRLFLQTTIILL